jgi:hypothetical protein
MVGQVHASRVRDWIFNGRMLAGTVLADNDFILPHRQTMAAASGNALIWSARTSPRFGTGGHVAQCESGDASPHSK